MSNLIPCPFCSGKAERCDNLTSGVEGVAACVDCGAANFLSDWNSRAPAPAPEAEALADAVEGLSPSCNAGAAMKRLASAYQAYRAAYPKEGSDGAKEGAASEAGSSG